MELRNIWEMLCRRNRLFILTIAVMTFVPLIAAYLMRPIYEVAAKVLIDTSVLQPRYVSSMNSDLGKLGYISSDNVISTYKALIETNAVNQKVLKALDVKDRGGKPLHVSKFVNPNIISLVMQGKGVKIEQDEDSETIKITGRSTDINEAVNIANNVTDSFLEFYSGLYKEEAFSAINAIKAKIADAKAKLSAAEELKNKYQRSSHIVDLSTQRTNMLSQISSLESSKTTAQDTYKTDSKKREATMSALSRQEEFKKSSVTTQANSLLDSYKSQLLTLEMSLSKTRIDSTDEHPDVKAILAQIEDVKRDFNKEMAKVFASETLSRNSYYDTLVQNLSDLEIDMVVQKANEKVLTEQIDKKYKELERFADLDMELTRLQREVDAQNTVYTSLLKDFEWAQMASNMSVANATLIQKAEITGSKLKTYIYFPNKKWIVIIAGFLGIFTGFFIVLFVDAVDNSVKNMEEAASASKKPIIGRIPFFKKDAVSHTPFWNILAEMDSDSKAIALISPERGDGRSFIAKNLAEVASRKGYKTLLVDGDLRNPCQHQLLGSGNTKGIIDWMKNGGDFNSFVQRTGLEGLHLLPAGQGLKEDPLKYLDISRLTELKNSALSSYDLVIMDTPPIDEVKDGLCIASSLGKAIFVLSLSKTSHESVKRAVDRIEDKRIEVIGSVVNRD